MTPGQVLDEHTRLYERLRHPPQMVTDFYATFFTERTARRLEADDDLLGPWLHMFVPARDEKEFLAMVCRPLYRAPTYQVSADIVAAVTATYQATISRGAVLTAADLPSETGFAWFDSPVVLTDAGGFSIATRAMSWGPQHVDYDEVFGGGGNWPEEIGRDGVRLTSYAHVDDADSSTNQEAADRLRSFGMPLSLSHSAFVPFGTPLPVRGPEGDVTSDDIFRWAHVLWMFMCTELVATARPQVERPYRRRAQRSVGAQSVNVVTLRRIRHGDSEVRHRDIDWTCRWIVQSHYRHLDGYPASEAPHHAKVFPGDREHCTVCKGRVAYIRAYVKGPDGMPLRAVPETVYRVAR